MRDQLEALEELARIDLGYRQLDIERDELEARLADLRSDVERIRDLLERERGQLAETENLRSQTFREVEDITERLNRSVKRQQVAKNARETEATQREVEVLRREREERVAKLAELDAVIPQVRESLARHEEDFAKLRDALAAEEAEAGAKMLDIDRRRRSQSQQREIVAARVRPDVLRKYNMIRERRGTAVAEVSGGICRGCHVAITQQLFAQIHSGKQLYQCPNCQRILVLRVQGTGG